MILLFNLQLQQQQIKTKKSDKPLGLIALVKIDVNCDLQALLDYQEQGQTLFPINLIQKFVVAAFFI